MSYFWTVQNCLEVTWVTRTHWVECVWSQQFIWVTDILTRRKRAQQILVCKQHSLSPLSVTVRHLSSSFRLWKCRSCSICIFLAYLTILTSELSCERKDACFPFFASVYQMYSSPFLSISFILNLQPGYLEVLLDVSKACQYCFCFSSCISTVNFTASILYFFSYKHLKMEFCQICKCSYLAFFYQSLSKGN